VNDEPHIEAEAADGEIVSGLPVPAERPGALLPVPAPAYRAAALAATGFVAGAAAVAVVHRRRSRVGGLRLGRRRKKGTIGEIVSSNSFLVDVHLIRR
jgi:hypothetical protein